MNQEDVVSCVMCTYGRFTCVERSIQFWINQDYEGKSELIIYNTSVEHPISLGEQIQNKFPEKTKNIKIINNNTNYLTKENYTNIGDIRRDALQHASGEYYICWDDDDIFLPWNIRQCMDGLKANPRAWAWKPKKSMMWMLGNDPTLAENMMEASIIVRLSKVIRSGFFAHQGGGEHINWIDEFHKEKKFHIENNSIPAYCFNWADEGKMRGHKQSGSIDRKDNFEYHKKNTTDHAKRPVGIFDPKEINKIYQAHINYIEKQIGIKNSDYIITQELFDKYIKKYKKIPLISFRTARWKEEELPEDLKIRHENFAKKIGGATMKYYDDDMCRKTIELYGDKEVLKAYDSLIPTSYKADLWRYVILYLYGGVYSDIDFQALEVVDFNEMVDCDMVLSLDLPSSGKGIQIALMAFKSKSKFLKYLIEEITSFINLKKYGYNHFDITGPKAFERIFKSFFNIDNLELKQYHKKGIDDNMYNIDIKYKQDGAGSMSDIQDKPIFLFKNSNDYYSLVHKDMTKHYSVLWGKRKVYKR